MNNKKLTKLRELVGIYQEGLKQASAGATKRDQINAVTCECLISFLQETLQISEDKSKEIGWFMTAIPREIPLAMDIHPYSAELLIALLPTIRPDGLSEYIKTAETAGLPTEMCSVDKGVIGLVLSGQLPDPDFIVGCSLPCDNIVIGYQMYSNIMKVPSFYPDAPYGDKWDDIAYFANELRQMIGFLEEQTGRKMDYDRLKSLIEESNRAFGYLLETNELRKAVPCPQSGKLLTMSNFVNSVATGNPKGTELYRLVRDDAKERAVKGIGVVPDERNRVIWFMIPTYFDLSIYDWMEEEFGAVIAMDMFSFAAITPIDTSSIDSMMEGLAIKALNMPMARQLRGPTDFYTDDLVRVCEEYQGDSVVFAGHEGCKMAWGSVGLIRDTCKEIDKPLLVFDLDAFDGRPSSSSDIKKRLEEFFNTMVPV